MPASQTLANQHGTTPFTTTAFASPTVAGRTIFVAMGSDDTAPPAPTVTDNKGNTYTQVFAIAGGDFNWASLYVGFIATGGSGHTITGATGNSGDNVFLCAMEVPNIVASSPNDKKATLHTPVSGVTVSTGTTAATTQAVEVAIGVNANDTGHANTSSFTSTITSILAGNVGMAMGYKDLVATGTQSGTFTDTITQDGAAGIATFFTQVAVSWFPDWRGRHLRRVTLPPRRGEFFAVPEPDETVIPNDIRRYRRPALPPRRGEFFTPLIPEEDIPGYPSRRRGRVALPPRRGEFFVPVLTVAPNTGQQLPAPAIVEPSRRQNNPQRFHRRSEWIIVPAPINNTTSPPVPVFIDPARRANHPLPPRRGHAFIPVPAPVNNGAQPVVPTFTRHQPTRVFVRRGHLFTVPPSPINTGTTPVVPTMERRAGDSTPRFVRARRGKFFSYPVLQTAPGPNPNPPPPSQNAGAFSPSINRRWWRAHRRAIMYRYSRT